MGFKADASFLKFLSMGALGVRQTMALFRAQGFEPIELERYCASNKIWTTKVKRLRLPDILCVRTGIRLEVRAKSDLKIRMSDAPTNPERTWDAKLRNDDIAAFIAIIDEPAGQCAADHAVFFTIGELRRSVAATKLGQPKSASEGAERDRTWPSITPSSDGIVLSVSPERLVVQMENGGKKRKQTYTLRGKHPYISPGDRFFGNTSILAGAPARTANLAAFRNRTYDPITGLRERDAIDRYAAVKALPYRKDLLNRAVPALERLLATEMEERVVLEAAGSAATLGSGLGQERIETVLWGDGRADLRMESVLILTELGSDFARQELTRVAEDATHFRGDEIRQAAVWGLGKAGFKAYDVLLPFIADPDENVALHAIAAFGKDTPETVIRRLVAELLGGDPRRAPAASETLRLIASDAVVRVLVEAAAQRNDWVLATLGRLQPNLVRPAIEGSALARDLAPMLLLSEGANWLASEDRVIDLAFLTKQNL